MPTLIKNMGKAKAPSFYGSVKSGGSAVKSKLPLFAVLILGGVAIIFVLRNKSGASQVGTGAALTLVPSNDSDASSITNMIQALRALSAPHSSTPSGGTSTPIIGTGGGTANPGPTVTTGSGRIVTDPASVGINSSGFNGLYKSKVGGYPDTDINTAASIDAAFSGAANAGDPHAARINPYPGAYAAGGYTGVASTTGVEGQVGIVQTVYRNGVIVGTVAGYNPDTVAIAARFGVPGNEIGTTNATRKT